MRTQESYVAVPGAALYVREVGDGPSMVVLHGGPDFNHNYLLPELDALASSFRLIYYDQRGRGKSSGTVAPETVGIGSEVEDLDRLRQHFGLARMVLLGHSWGGVLAMAYATAHADRVSHLVLLNSAPGSYADRLRMRSEREETEAAILAKMHAIADTAGYAEGDIETEADYYRLHFAAALRGSGRLDSVVQRLRAHFTPADIVKARIIEERLYAETWLKPEFDLLAPLSKAGVPTLTIHGDRDLVPLECARRIADAVPGSRLIVLRNCGHFSYLERPAEVFAAIDEFCRLHG